MDMKTTITERLARSFMVLVAIAALSGISAFVFALAAGSWTADVLDYGLSAQTGALEVQGHMLEVRARSSDFYLSRDPAASRAARDAIAGMDAELERLGKNPYADPEVIQQEEQEMTKPKATQAARTALNVAGEGAMHVSEDMFLGEVLFGAGMVDRYQLENAMHIHHHEGVCVGEACVRIGALTEEELEKGLALQANLRFIAGLTKKSKSSS